jgi:regulator of telomere elongation helicase 1
MIEALDNEQNALLESPTGTGKTMNLLCASLAWMKTNPEKKCQIIYASRTHSQLVQVIDSLKQTAFQPKTVLLASRDHLCVNDTARYNQKN